MKRALIILLEVFVAIVALAQRTEYSQLNTTFDELGSGETWTGTGENVVKYEGGLAIPEKTDIKFRILSITNANADVAIVWDMVLSQN